MAVNPALAPIAFIAYARPHQARTSLEALSRARLAPESKLFIFADGAKEGASEETRAAIAQVRALLRSRPWCGEVEIVERSHNLGLRRSILDAVDRLTRDYGRVIVIEDDVEVGEGFLEYANGGLDLYADDPRVFQISGYVVPHGEAVPETSFTDTFDCWGWATWRRAWLHYNGDVAALMAEVRRRGERRRFDFDGTYTLYRQLQRQQAGEIDTWDPQWYASLYLAGGLCLVPDRAVVRNVGLDSSGVHCESNPYYHIDEVKGSVRLERQPPVLHPPTRAAVVGWYRRNRIRWRAKRLWELLRDDRAELWSRVRRYTRFAVEARR